MEEATVDSLEGIEVGRSYSEDPLLEDESLPGNVDMNASFETVLAEEYDVETDKTVPESNIEKEAVSNGRPVALNLVETESSSLAPPLVCSTPTKDFKQVAKELCQHSESGREREIIISQDTQDSPKESFV